MATTMTRYQPETGMTRLPDLMDRLFKESFVLPTFLDRFTEGGTARPGLAANLYETNDGRVRVTLNNFCKILDMGPEDHDDILGLAGYLLADAVEARDILQPAAAA